MTLVTKQAENSENQNTEADTDAGEHQTETLESLRAERDALAAEAAKERGIRKTLQAERDKAKKATQTAPKDSGEDYKQLWEQSNSKLTKMQEQVKQSAVKAALTTKLSASKVQADKLDAAIALLDQSLVEWDEDSGVDNQSITAAVQKLKGNYAWLFETKVTANQLKPAAEGSATGKTITRAEFDRLSPADKMTKMVTEKFTVID